MRRLRLFPLFLSLLLSFFISQMGFGQTTGKISGKVLDADSGDPLPGTNVMIEGTTRGAAADQNGNFFILNLPPGVYTLRVQMMGYGVVRLKNVRVSVNRTATVKVGMKMTALKTEEVVIVASKATVKKDQTSSIKNVSSDQINLLPVEKIGDVIKMQSGVVAGHFRGGRKTEVSYMIDGMQVDESFLGEGRTVEVEPEVIQDLEVITGTFNAEYGRAMSGVVNAVTKSGGNKLSGSFSGNFANYLTGNKAVFIGLRDGDITRNQDYKFQLSGPVLKNRLAFFANFRFQNNKNYLNGIRRFEVNNYSNFAELDSANWYSEHTGDSAYVPLNDNKNISFLGKLTSAISKNMKMSVVFTLNDDEWQNYDHYYKYNPDGLATLHRKTKMVSLQFNHLLSQTAFYESRISFINSTYGNYLFKNPLDARYVNDWFARYSGSGFSTGGQQKHHEERTLADLNAKFDLTWQVNKNHSLKIGTLLTRHDLQQKSSSILNFYRQSDVEYEKYRPVVLPDSSIYSDIYRMKPREYSGYLQDKIEFDEMVINLGVRYDYFDANTVYPSQRRNPANQLNFYEIPGRMSTYPKAKAKYQISPRFGLAYQLSDVALLHFSYGHFFQMPPMYALYENHAFRVAPTNYATTMGNAQINAQKTVQYEIGLWQELMTNMGIEVSLFYRDIYDLLSATVITTYNQIKYGLYTNKDYGNAKGIELKYDFVADKFSAYINYTLQYTRGNADNPKFNFDRAGNSRDPVPTLIPMSWDQRHTLNVTVGYNTKSYGLTTTGYYDSGTPYTWAPLDENPLSLINLYPNNATKPGKFTVDVTGYYLHKLSGGLQLRITLAIYNLFDRLNENEVYNRTGRAYTDIIKASERASHRSNFNDYLDRIHNPGMFAPPRMVKVGLGVVF